MFASFKYVFCERNLYFTVECSHCVNESTREYRIVLALITIYAECKNKGKSKKLFFENIYKKPDEIILFILQPLLESMGDPNWVYRVAFVQGLECLCSIKSN